MVSLVLVSHSRALAEALIPLVRQMASDEVEIAVAAGTGEEDADFGTNAVAILEAIESVDSSDGILILGDVGSALLSTDTALDLLSEEVRARTRISPAPLVEGALTAAVQASMGSDLETVAAEARRALDQKQQHIGDDEEASQPPPRARQANGGQSAATLEVELANPHGLHARPAAQLVRTAAQFDATLTVENLTRNQGPVPAESISAVSTLGAVQGHRLRVSAQGPEAEPALQAVQALVESHFDEKEDEEESAVGPVASMEPYSPVQTAEDLDAPSAAGAGDVRGVGIHPGVAVGPAIRFEMTLPELPEETDDDPEQAWSALKEALDTVRAQLEEQAASGTAAAGILDAQALLLDDPELRKAARNGVFENRKSAARAWTDTVDQLAERYEAVEDDYLQARAEDVRDVGRRIALELIGETADAPVLPDEPSVLVATHLPPSIVPQLDPERIIGVVCAGGSPTAHNAILLRGQDIPTVFGAGSAVERISEGMNVGLDGGTGQVWINPPSSIIDRLEEKQVERTHQAAADRIDAHAPARMTDGTLVSVDANVSRPDDAEAATENGADGVGLLRTEFLFTDVEAAPSEQAQVDALARVARAMDDRPMTIRVLDAGGDKPLDYLSFPREQNPFLGLRGIRVLLRHRALFHTQLRAILRVAAEHPIRLLLPMIATVDEVHQAQEVLDGARSSLEADGLDPTSSLPFGIMVETPASALSVAQFVPHVDFFSIGTNDLTQYVMAADREHAALRGFSDALHPAVLRLMRQATRAAGDCSVSVCGEIAADPLAVPLLLGIGIDRLSIRPVSIPSVKALIRSLSREDVETLADKALAASTAEEVRRLSRSLVDTRPPR